MMNCKFFTLLFAFATVSLSAENVLFNSGFELGTAGFSALRNRPLKTFQGEFDPAGGIFPEQRDVKSGRGAIRLVHLPGQSVTLCSSEFRLEPDARYTFSFWAKGDPGTEMELKLSSRQSENGKLAWKDISRSFRLSGGWKEYSCTFTSAPAPHRFYNFYFLSKHPGTILADDIQLIPGESAKPWAPAAPVESAVILPEITADTKTFSGILRTVAYNRDCIAAVNLALRKFESTEQLAGQTVRVPLKAGIMQETDFQFSGAPYGCFQVFPSIDGKPLPPGAAGITVNCHAPVWKNTSDASGFKLGVNTAILGRYAGTRSVIDSIGTGEELGKKLIYLGNVHRIWNPGEISWAICNPAPGKFDFSRILKSADIARRNGFGIEVTISDGWTWMKKEEPNRNMPEWTWKRDLAGSNYPTADRRDTNRKVKLPYYEDWAAFAGAFAKATKGTVRYIDLMNEPNCSFSGKTYAAYMKAAYDAVKKENPAAVVVAGSATEDLGARALEYVVELVNSKERDSMDILSFHPYGARQDDSPIPAQNRIRQFKAAVRSAGMNVPLWNDECFYLKPVSQSHYMLEHDLPPGAVSRRIIIDMGEGCFASTPLAGDQAFGDPGNPNRVVQSWDSRHVPTKLFVEMNALAHFLAGAKPLAVVERKGEYLGYVFSNHGRLWSAIWSAADPAVLNLGLPRGASFRLYDLYGNPLTADASRLSLSRVPCYLQWSGVSAEQAAELLRNGIVHVDNPVQAGPVRWVKRGAQTGILFELSNRGSKPLSGFVRVNAPEFRGNGGRVEFQAVENGKPRMVFVPLTRETASSGQFRITVLVSDGRKLFPFERMLVIPPLLSLKEGIWSGPYPVARLAEGKAPASAADLSAKFFLLREKNALVVRVSVTDDKAEAGTSMPFAADCIELFWDPAPFRGDMKYPDRYNETTCQIFINPYRKPVTSIANGKKLPGLNVSVTERGNGYEALIRLPFPGNTEYAGFDLGIDDSDAPNHRKTQLVWSGDGGNHSNRSKFGMLILKDK